MVNLYFLKKSYLNPLVPDISIVSHEGRRLNLQGLGPFNWLVEFLIADHLEMKMSDILKKECQDLLSVVEKVSVVDHLYIDVSN